MKTIEELEPQLKETKKELSRWKKELFARDDQIFQLRSALKLEDDALESIVNRCHQTIEGDRLIAENARSRARLLVSFLDEEIVDD